MSMEYHRGRARGVYRRQATFLSFDFPGVGKTKATLMVSGGTSAGVKKMKSLWMKVTGFTQSPNNEYAVGYTGFYRGDTAPSATAIQDIFDPNLLDPKPFVFTGNGAQQWEHYLKGVNLAANENLYFVCSTLIQGGTPSCLGAGKYVEDRSLS